MKNTAHFNGIRFFWKGLKSAKKDMWASIQVLVIATIVLSLGLYIVEHIAQPDVYSNIGDSFIYGVMSYLGNPGKFSPGEPITLVGRLIAIIIAILKILIFAVPAGLVAKGFNEAMNEEKRQKRVREFSNRLHKAFHPSPARRINDYLRSQGSTKKVSASPCFLSVVTLQTDYHMDTRDIMDAAEQYPEFRLANLATIQTEAENPQDRLVVLHSVHNRPYGCCINRNSKITIVVTSAQAELATEWFGNLIAELGGFNFICKNIEIDHDNSHSYFNMKDIDQSQVVDKQQLKVLEQERVNQDTFYEDLKTLSKGEDHWNIYLLHIVTNSTKGGNHTHFNSAMKDGENPTIHDIMTYQCVKEQIVGIINEYGLKCTTDDSERFPLTRNNVAYRLEKDGICPNSFAFRMGAHLMAKHTYKELMAYRIAEVLQQKLLKL